MSDFLAICFSSGSTKAAGIGPKKALALIKKHGKKFDEIFKEAEWEKHFDFSWEKVYDTIKNIPVTDEYNLKWETINSEKIYEILVERHDFLKERVENSILKLTKNQAQKGLSDFF